MLVVESHILYKAKQEDTSLNMVIFILDIFYYISEIMSRYTGSSRSNTCWSVVGRVVIWV